MQLLLTAPSQLATRSKVEVSDSEVFFRFFYFFPCRSRERRFQGLQSTSEPLCFRGGDAGISSTKKEASSYSQGIIAPLSVLLEGIPFLMNMAALAGCFWLS